MMNLFGIKSDRNIPIKMNIKEICGNFHLLDIWPVGVRLKNLYYRGRLEKKILGKVKLTIY